MKKILILGSKSFIGSNFYNFIVKNKSFSVSFIDRNKKDKDTYILNNKKILNNICEINKVFSNNEFVFSFIGSNKFSLFDKDQKTAMETILTFANMAAQSLNLKKFIFLSSFSVYDEKLFEKINYNTPTNPKRSYGKYKLMIEQKLLNLFKDKLSKLIILRIPIVLDSDKNSIKKFKKIFNYLIFKPLITNKNRRSYVTSQNLNELFLYIISKNLDKTIILFSNKSNFSSDQLVSEIINKKNKSKINPFLLIINIYFIIKFFSLLNFSFANKLLFSSHIDKDLLKEYFFIKETDLKNLI